LEKIVIPAYVNLAYTYVFARCTALQEAYISADRIPNYAFYDCASLHTVYLSNNVSNISISAFRNCPNLLNIYCNFSEDEVEGAPWGATNATIHYNSTGPEEE
jgi:hypothetical protein